MTGPTVAQDHAFHLRGRHVQHAHGSRKTELADGDHLGCGMIALMPTEADAKRLKLPGGETAEDLHVTLFFLGCDMAGFSQDDRVSVTNRVMDAITEAGPATVTGNAFGVNHWNGNGDDPCWVLGVGDVPSENRGDGTRLETVRETVGSGLDMNLFPEPHTPWAPHVCMAYTKDLTLAKELQKRLGPVEFDRVRVAFGGEYTDIPLSGPLTAAAAPLRRNLTPVEVSAHTDFARMQDDWASAVDAVLKALAPVRQTQIEQVTAQVRVIAQADDMDALEDITADEEGTYAVLFPALMEAAQLAAEGQQQEAEAQGVNVPEWSLTASAGGALTASVGRDLLKSVARVTARILSSSLVQSAVRRALLLFGRGNTPELVTAGVQDHLEGLTEAGPRDAVGGAITQAQNEGRRTVLSVAPVGRYFSSEVLDKSSCAPCRRVDGTEYATLAESAVAYPSGGYRDCLGDTRCRGTIVTVWSAPSGATASGAVTAAEGTAMPWKVVEDHGECGPDEPFAVVKEADGSVEGCHATREDAEAQVAALYSSEEDSGGDGVSLDYAAGTAPWTGPLAVEGIVTGDGREFAPGALTWADLPVPLRWNKEDSHGGEPHTVAVNVGRIDKIWREDEKIMGSGVLNLAEDDGRRVYEMIKGKFIRGVSIDADSIADADVEFVWPENENGGGEPDEEADIFEMLFAQPEKMIFHGGRIRAATLVDIPAFAEAYISLTDEDGTVVAAGRPYRFGAVAVHETGTSDASWDSGANEKRLPSPLTETQARAAYAWFEDAAVENGGLPKSAAKFLHHEISDDGSAGPANLAACSAAVGALHGARGGADIPEGDRQGVYDHVAAHLRDAGMTPEPFHSRAAVTASVALADLRPPKTWFSDPGLSVPTPITVDSRGRVYGHAAQWGQCHVGFPDQCVSPPQEDSHPYFMTGEVLTDNPFEGESPTVSVGQITVGTGHAALHLGAQAASQHYDHTGFAVADVAVGNDAHGIWVAGAVRPSADASRVHELRASGQVSGDWRRIGGQLRLVGLLAVNVPGFPVPRMRARVASGAQVALVAAGKPTVARPSVEAAPVTILQAYRIVMDSLHERAHEGVSGHVQL